MNVRAFILLFVLLPVGSFGQGTINFSSFADAVDAPVRDTTLPGNPLCSGSSYLAQLDWGAVGTSDPLLLTTNGISGTAVAFATGIGTGYFFGGTRTISGTGIETITLQVRAWRADSGENWESATVRGESSLFQVTTDLPPGPAPNLVGFHFFNLSAVPEPGAWALLALGSALFWCAARRRRK